MNAAESNISASMQSNWILGNCGEAQFWRSGSRPPLESSVQVIRLRLSLHTLKRAKQGHMEGTVLNFGGLDAG
jgi:hypothetical protein